MHNPVDTILQGDALAVLATLPANYIQACVTSPPYYGLRDYQVKGQIGLEETPEQYTCKLVEVFRQVKRVLRDDGVLWLNLGDSYAAGKQGRGDEGKRISDGVMLPHWKHAPGGKQRKAPEGLAPKNLLGIPWRVAFALQADGWILRSAVIWHKPNAMPESVKDRPTNDYEHVFMLAKNERYFYDHTAILEPQVTDEKTFYAKLIKQDHKQVREYGTDTFARTKGGLKDATYNPLGRNKRTVWSIATKPYNGAHFAVMPEKLVEPCVLSSSRPDDIILDPFSGAGTVAYVSAKLGRSYLGIELNPDYIVLAQKRLEPLHSIMEKVA